MSLILGARRRLGALGLGVAVAIVCATSVAGAVDLVTGDIVITDLNSSSPGLLTRIRAGGQTQIVPSSPIDSPYGVAISPLGNLYVTQRVPGVAAVYRVDPNTGERLTILEGGPLAGPSGIAIDAAGDLIVADREGDAILRIDPHTTVVTTVSMDGFFQFIEGIAISPSGDLFVTDGAASAGYVYRVDPSSGAQTIVASGGGLVTPRGIAIDSAGKLVVADRDANKLFRIDPAAYNPGDPGANQVVVSDSQGGAFTDPAGVAIEPDGNILVADTGADKVFRVNPATGVKTVVVSTVTSGGPLAIAVAGSIPVCPSDPSCDDEPPPDPTLGQSLEIDPGHPDIVAKAAELGSPVQIFKFVRNQIEFEPYYGSKKGALGTLWSGSGNDFDQASLLISLLRARGISARYVIGVVQVDVDQLMQWAGVRDPAVAAGIFKLHYCLNRDDLGACAASPKRFEVVNDPQAPGVPAFVRMERAWVEARVPSVYRGLDLGDSSTEWLALDPSWKRKLYRNTVDLPIVNEVAAGGCEPNEDLCFDYDAYYSSVDPRLASEIWEGQIQAWLAKQPETVAPLGSTSEDVIYDGPIIPYLDEVLPLSLPFIPERVNPPLVATLDLGTIADGLQRRFRLAVALCAGSCSTATTIQSFAFVELVGKRLAFTFEPYINPTTRVLWFQKGGALGFNEFCLQNGGPIGCQLYAVLRLDGRSINVDTGTFWSVGADVPPVLQLRRDFIPGYSPTDLAPFIPGMGPEAEAIYPLNFADLVAIGLDANQSSNAQVQKRIGALLAFQSQFEFVSEGDGDANGNSIFGETLLDQGDPGITSCPYTPNPFISGLAFTTCDISVDVRFGAFIDTLLGEVLHIASLRYLQRLREESERVLQLDGYASAFIPNVMLAKAGRSYTYLFNQPVGVEPGAPTLDLRASTQPPVDIDGPVATDPSWLRRELRLLGHIGSSLEHQVWEELIGSEFVSTVKGIQLVRERFPTQSLQTFTNATQASIDSALAGFAYDPISAATRVIIESFADTPTETVITPVAAVSAHVPATEVFIAEQHSASVIGILMGITVGGQLLGGSCSLLGCVDPLADLLEDYGLSDLIAARETTQGFGTIDIDWSFTPPNAPELIREALAGDPVSMVSGNLHHTERDLVAPTDGPSFELTRTYNSQIHSAGALGFGWTHSYEARLEPVRDAQQFVYLPSALANFQVQNRVEGPRSDTLDTKNVGTGSTERIDWAPLSLPAAPLSQLLIDGIDVEIAFNGTFNVQPQTGQAQIALSSPSTGPPAYETIPLKQANGSPYVNLAELLSVVLSGFGPTDTLHFARLRIRYRGPAIQRHELVPSSFSGWDAGVTALQDADPSTCVSPMNREATITYQAQTPTNVLAYELLAAVHRTPDPPSGEPEARMWRGTAASGEAFLMGPNHANGARQRFMSGNTQSYGFLLTFDRDLLNEGAAKKHRLCQVEYRILTVPEQFDFVAEDGSRARFTKIDGEWQAAPGVREKLEPLLPPEAGYRLTRPDGRTLTFGREAASGTFQLTLVSDPQGRSLGLTYDASDRLEEVTWLNSPAPPQLREALTFHYVGVSNTLDFVKDWANRTWDYTVDAGNLIEARDPVEVENGWPGVKYQYSAGHTNEELNHNLKRITFPKDVKPPAGGDRWIAFEYFNSDRVASHTDSLGNRQTFLFNVPRQESQTTDPRGFTTVYRHDLKGNLLQRVDPDGATWTWEYDADRNVVAETDPLGRVRRFENFDERGNPGRMVDRDGRAVEYTYDPVSGAPNTVLDKRENLRSVTFTNDGLPEQVSATVGGQSDVTLVTNVYDPTSRVLRDTMQPYGDGTGRIGGARYDYFPGNRDVRTIERGSYLCNPTCVLSTIVSTTSYEYDELGRVEAESISREKGPEDLSLIPLRTEYDYDARGRLLSATRPDGTVRVSSYDRNGNLELEYLLEPRPVGDPIQHERTEYVYDEIDRLEQIIDANGGITRFEYDASGNRIAATDPAGNTSRIAYDALNRPVRAIDPNGSVTTTEYDLMGRVIAVIDPTGVRTTRAYDEIGTLIALRLGNKNPATRKLCYSDDWQENGCRDQVAANGYDELLTDPNGKSTVFKFDELGRVVEHVDGTPEEGVTQMEYDLRGILREVIDPIGGRTTFNVDPLGRVNNAKRPYTTAAEITKYDATGNPIRITRPGGCELLQEFDEMGRLLHRWTSGAPACLANERTIDDYYGYDARGLLVAAQNDYVGLLRDYDKLGRLTRETDDRFGTSIAYHYNAASRLTAKVYPDGKLLHVAYDAAGRPVGITDPTGDTTRYVYDAAGRRVQTRSTASSLRSDLAYDAVGRLESIASYRADGTARPLQGYPSYDHAGNRLAMQNELGSTTYAYDALHRLVTADPPGGGAVHYDYDAAGNRMHSGQQDGSGGWTPPYDTYSYMPPGPQGPTHKLETVLDANQAAQHTFTYYQDGNVGFWSPGATPTRRLHWDALARLVKIDFSFSATYRYDPLGRRIEKTELGQTLRYQYDGLDVVAEYDGANALLATYVFGPGIDEPIKIRRGTTLAAYHSDGLGSILAVSSIDSTGSADLLTYRYDAFGVIEDTTGTLDNTYTYTGRELDATGLYYYRSRYYLPSVGRFLSPDPIGLEGGINPYAYVGSNPVNYTDPFGLAAVRGGSAIAINTASPIDFPAFARATPTQRFTSAVLQAPFAYSDYLEQMIGGHSLGVLDRFEKDCGSNAACLTAAAQLRAQHQVIPNILSAGIFATDLAVTIATGFSKPSAGLATVAAGMRRAAVLSDDVARTFEGGRYSARTLSADMIVFRAEGDRFGRWFGTVRPGSAAEAERLYNAVTYGNDLLEVSTYRIPAGTRLFEGRVAGGTGMQVYVQDPRAAGIRLLETKPLPQYGY